MKIAVFCQLWPETLARLQRHHSCALAVNPDDDVKRQLLSDAEVVVVRSPVSLDRAALDVAHRLRLIVRAGVGWDNVDRGIAQERGIEMISVPVSSESVAEHAFGLILGLYRGIPRLHFSLRQGHWEKHRSYGHEVSGKILGLLGFGRIGIRMASIGTAFGMTVLAHDRSPQKPHKQTAARTFGVEFVSLPDLFSRADVLTIQLPLEEDSRHLVGEDLIGHMQPESILVNVARGHIVDEVALYHALRNGRLFGAASDVFAEEPPWGNPLLELDNFIGTPHVGAQTIEAQQHVGAKVEQIIEEFRERQ